MNKSEDKVTCSGTTFPTAAVSPAALHSLWHCMMRKLVPAGYQHAGDPGLSNPPSNPQGQQRLDLFMDLSYKITNLSRNAV